MASSPIKKQSFPRDHIIFVNTTTQEKVDQLNAVAREYGYPAHFLRITDLGRPSHSPTENEFNFTAHVTRKAKGAADLLSGFTKEQIHKRLRDLGYSQDRINRAQFYGAAEDSGLTFPPRLAQAFLNTDPENGSPYTLMTDREVIESIHGLDKFRAGMPFPGTEFAPVVESCSGIANFRRLLNLAAEKAGYDINPRSNPENRSTRKKNKTWVEMGETSTLGIFKWNPGEKIMPAQLEGRIKVTETKDNGVPMVFDGTVEPVEGKEFTSYSCTIPMAEALNGTFRSRETLGDKFMPQGRTNAMRTLMKTLKIEPIEKGLRQGYAYAHAESLAKAYKNIPYSVALAHCGGHAARESEKLISQLADGKQIKMESFGQDTRFWKDLSKIEEMMKTHDAFVLLANPNEDPQG